MNRKVVILVLVALSLTVLGLTILAGDRRVPKSPAPPEAPTAPE